LGGGAARGGVFQLSPAPPVAASRAAATGRAYVNFLTDPGAAPAAYGEEKYARLVTLKNEYDPTNVFRLNQNIAPDGE